MEHPIKVAFCPLLFANNGGKFSSSGLPIFDGEDYRGSCDIAYDCNDCFIMKEWLSRLSAEGWVYGWECSLCLKDTSNLPRKLPGFYNEGSIELEGQEKPSVPGCTRCGWKTFFLQLVLRSIK